MDKRKNLTYIGKNYFDFDSEYELIIYKYLCNIRLNNKELGKLKNEDKFLTYMQWKEYISTKYKNYNDNALLEFMHYLNQKIRNEDSVYESYRVFIPILLTILSNKLCEQMDNILESDINILFYIGVEIVIIVVAIMISVVMVAKMFEPIISRSLEKNFYSDYKKEIERILREHDLNIFI